MTGGARVVREQISPGLEPEETPTAKKRVTCISVLDGGLQRTTEKLRAMGLELIPANEAKDEVSGSA